MFFVNKLADSRYKVDHRAQRFQGFRSFFVLQVIITLFSFLGIMTGVSIIHIRFVLELNLGACEEQTQTSFVNFEICITIKTFLLQC